MSNSNANINSYMEVNPVIRDQSRAYFYKCRMLVDRSKGLANGYGISLHFVCLGCSWMTGCFLGFVGELCFVV